MPNFLILPLAASRVSPNGYGGGYNNGTGYDTYWKAYKTEDGRTTFDSRLAGEALVL